MGGGSCTGYGDSLREHEEGGGIFAGAARLFPTLQGEDFSLNILVGVCLILAPPPQSAPCSEAQRSGRIPLHASLIVPIGEFAINVC